MGSPVPSVSQNHKRASASRAIPSLVGTCGGIGTGASGSTGACAAAMRGCPVAPAQNASIAALPVSAVRRLMLRRLFLPGDKLGDGRVAVAPAPVVGEGWVGGAGGCGTKVPGGSTPTQEVHSLPSPQGREEKLVASPRRALTLMSLVSFRSGISIMVVSPVHYSCGVTAAITGAQRCGSSIYRSSPHQPMANGPTHRQRK